MSEPVSGLDWLLEEAERRGLWPVAGIYAVVTWFLIQFGVTIVEALRLPGWVVRTLIGMTLAGLPVALALAWIFNEPGRGEGEEAPERAPRRGGPLEGFGPVQKSLIVFFLLAGVGLWAWRRTVPPQPVDGGERPAAAILLEDPPPPAESLRRIAVLPFSVLGGDSADIYFAHGMSEQVRNRLARVPELRVVSRTSSARFAGAGVPARRVAGHLRARSLLEGAVQRTGDRLRVTVQLVDAAEDVTLWSESYDRELGDLFAVEEEIARSVARELKVKLGGDPGPAADGETVTLEAHDLYLLGLHHWNRRTGPEMRKALSFFRRAADSEPGYAEAYAGIAATYVLFPLYTDEPPEEAMPRAREAALRALELDSALAGPHATLGFIRTTYEYDWEEAEASFRRAIDLNPSHATAHQWYGLMLDAVGRHDEGRAHVEQAFELDPLSLIIRETVGIHHLLVGDYGPAVNHLERALEMEPDFPLGLRFLSEAHLLAGRHAEAREAVRRRAELIGADAARLLRAVGGVTGDVEPGRAIRALRGAVRAGEITRYEAAGWAAQMGRPEEALGWLEDAYERRDYLLFFMGVDPALAAIRDEPRYRAVAREMGLAGEGG